jgi:DNA excision repair protein ERCC-2
MTEYTVAVRELAAFCFRCGDIDYRFTPSPTGVEGVEGHQQVYRRRPSSYLQEHSLQASFEAEDFSLLLRGRADGYDPQAGYVEEIKTCRVARDAVPAAVETLHWSQALLYAALVLAAEPERLEIEVRLTWYNIDTEQEWQRVEILQRQTLDSLLTDAVSQYQQWLVVHHQWRRERDASITALDFPFRGYRSGQREMAEIVYKCIAQGGQLLLQAPTGIGKTAAVLYPALKAMAADKHDVIVFVTARTVGRRAAEDSFAQFAEAGLRLRSLSLTAKETVCFSPGKACHGEDCPFAAGYYDRLPAAREAAMAETVLNRDAVEELARRFTVCPYQLAADLLPWVDATVADIHYVYSFYAGLARQMEASSLRWSVLLDEAHNLPERGRNMYSASFSKRSLMAARKEADGIVRRALDRCNRALLDLLKLDWQEADFHMCEAPPPALETALQSLIGAVAEQQVISAEYLNSRRVLLEFYFDMLQFLRVLEVFGDSYRFEMQRDAHPQSLVVRLNCLDAAPLLEPRQRAPVSVTAFSATVSPPSWVGPGLGFATDFVFLSLPSPFQPAQLEVEVNTAVDTRYRARQRTLPRLQRAIEGWLEDNPGNCIVYFPSYQYMQDTLDGMPALGTDRKVLVQEREQSEASRAQLLGELRERDDVAAFCILGGIFGEGIDLPGDDLRSVVIVGVGLPQFNRERQVQRDYFAARYGHGFEYAYLFPGMQKVNQALGRVVRRESDSGRALLLDSRYGEPEYRDLLPPWWRYEVAGREPTKR